MLPPTRTSKPLALSISPTIVVTVVFPLDPVIAMTGAGHARAKSSMSPNISIFRLRAALRKDSLRETPGLTTTTSTPFK